MTLLIVAAVVMLAVRIAVVLLICTVQCREKRVLSGAEHSRARVSPATDDTPCPGPELHHEGQRGGSR